MHPQQHYHVPPSQSLLRMTRDTQARRKSGRNLGYELWRTAQCHLHPELCQQMASGACNATMVDIADNRNLQALERFLVFQDGEGIDQGLRGLLVHAVAS